MLLHDHERKKKTFKSFMHVLSENFEKIISAGAFESRGEILFLKWAFREAVYVETLQFHWH